MSVTVSSDVVAELLSSNVYASDMPVVASAFMLVSVLVSVLDSALVSVLVSVLVSASPSFKLWFSIESSAKKSAAAEVPISSAA